MTGSGVTEASIPGRWAAPPAPAMMTRSPRAAAALAVGDHLLRHPVCRDDVGLVGDPELPQALRRLAHHRPVAVAAHDDADDGLAALLGHPPHSPFIRVSLGDRALEVVGRMAGALAGVGQVRPLTLT